MRGPKYAEVSASIHGQSRLVIDYKWDMNMYTSYGVWARSWVLLDEREVLIVDRSASEHGPFPSGWTGSRRQIPAGFDLEPGWHKLQVQDRLSDSTNRTGNLGPRYFLQVDFLVASEALVDLLIIPAASVPGCRTPFGQVWVQYRDLDDPTIGRRPAWRGPASVDRNGQRIAVPIRSEPWPQTGDGWS